MDFSDIPSVTVDLKEVSPSDTDFKISRNFIDPGLLQSVSTYGILEPPVLLRQENRLRVLFGHNRIEALRQSGGTQFRARICVNTIEPDAYLDHARLKNYRNELGPAGRIRLLRILREHFKMDSKQVIETVSREFGVPAQFASEDASSAVLDKMPEGLRDYCDIRGVNFRVIGKLLQLPPDFLPVLDSWIALCQMRLNVFRSVVDICTDIWRRDGSLDSVAGIGLSGIEDRRRAESYIYENLQAHRYPEFISMRGRAEGIREYFNSRDMGLDYPEYFEGADVTLSVKLKRGDDPENLLCIFNDNDVDKLREILALL